MPSAGPTRPNRPVPQSKVSHRACPHPTCFLWTRMDSPCCCSMWQVSTAPKLLGCSCGAGAAAVTFPLQSSQWLDNSSSLTPIMKLPGLELIANHRNRNIRHESLCIAHPCPVDGTGMGDVSVGAAAGTRRGHPMVSPIAAQWMAPGYTVKYRGASLPGRLTRVLQANGGCFGSGFVANDSSRQTRPDCWSYTRVFQPNGGCFGRGFAANEPLRQTHPDCSRYFVGADLVDCMCRGQRRPWSHRHISDPWVTTHRASFRPSATRPTQHQQPSHKGYL